MNDPAFLRPVNATELANTPHETGGEVLCGALLAEE